MGHNTTAVVEPDGTFAVITSEIVPGWFFGSDSLAGPWAYQGTLSVDTNGHSDCNLVRQMVPFGGPKCAPFSNLSVTVGPDQRFWATSRHGQIMVSDHLIGPYKIAEVSGVDIDPKQVASIIPNHPPMMDWGVAEDPVIWYSGGCYHVVFDYWNAPNSPPSTASAAVKAEFPTNCGSSSDTRCTLTRGYHLMSRDGIHDWVNTGVAYDPETDFIRYTDGTVNHWHNMERAGVYLENGHPVAFTFVVTSTNKNTTTISASKILVVPFDGVSFDADNRCEPESVSGQSGSTGSGGTSPGGTSPRGTNPGGGTGGSTASSGGSPSDVGVGVGVSGVSGYSAGSSGWSASEGGAPTSGASSVATSSSGAGSSGASASSGSTERGGQGGGTPAAPTGCGRRTGGDRPSGTNVGAITMLVLLMIRRRSDRAS